MFPLSPTILWRALLEKFLCLVHLRRQVWTTATIGVVEQHECSMGFPDLLFGDGSLAALESVVSGPQRLLIDMYRIKTHFSDRINDASFLFMRGSNPPL